MEGISGHMKEKVSFRVEKAKYEFRLGVNKVLIVSRGD